MSKTYHPYTFKRKPTIYGSYISHRTYDPDDIKDTAFQPEYYKYFYYDPTSYFIFWKENPAAALIMAGEIHLYPIIEKVEEQILRLLKNPVGILYKNAFESIKFKDQKEFHPKYPYNSKRRFKTRTAYKLRLFQSFISSVTYNPNKRRLKTLNSKHQRRVAKTLIQQELSHTTLDND